MKKNTKRLIQIIGGIIMMAGISGCGVSGNHQDTSSSITESRVKASRTPEEAAVEAQFGPLFEFLAAEQKDFSKVKSFSGGLSISRFDAEKDEYVGFKSWDIIFAELETSDKGLYKIFENDMVVTYSATINHLTGEITFLESNIELNQYVLPTVQTEELHNLKISSYRSGHPETELISLSYKTGETFSIIKQIVDEYKIENIDGMRISMQQQGNKEFSFQVSVGNEQYHYIIGFSITFE